MRLMILLCSMVVSMLAANQYELQLVAAKSYNATLLNQYITKGEAAGLKCHIVSELRDGDKYHFVRCDKTFDKATISESVQKANDAGLAHFIVTRESKHTHKSSALAPQNMDLRQYDLSQRLFGTNHHLLVLLNNQNEITKTSLEQRKKEYLDAIAREEEFSGLYLKGSSANNFDQNRMDYNLRLEWDIFENGYMDAKYDTQEVLLHKELAFDKLLDKYQTLNLKLSDFQIHIISNHIHYAFLKERKALLQTIMRKKEKAYNASLITSQTYYQTKKELEQTENALHYYESTIQEPFDLSLKPLMLQIENSRLIDI